MEKRGNIETWNRGGFSFIYLRSQTILTPRFHVSMFLVLKKRK